MASRFWVGGTASWDGTAGTKWATTSGGTGGASAPASTDDVFFDANSGAVTVTVSSVDCKNLDFTGFTGTFTSGSVSLGVYGSITAGSGMTWSFAGALSMLATSGTQVVTSNGISFTNLFFVNGIGGTTQLADNFVTNSVLRVDNGTFDANNKNVTCFGFRSNFTSSTRTVTMGSGTWTLNGTGTVWNTSSITNLTLNAGSSTIKITNSSGTSVTFSGGGATLNNVWFSRGSSTGSITIIGSNTFADFKDDGTAAHSILFTTGTTQTFTTFTVSGSSGNLITINSDTTGTHSLVKSGGGTVSCDYLNIQHSIATPSSTWYAGTHSTDNQAVATAGSGWIFTAPPGGLVNGGFFLMM